MRGSYVEIMEYEKEFYRTKDLKTASDNFNLNWNLPKKIY